MRRIREGNLGAAQCRDTTNGDAYHASFAVELTTVHGRTKFADGVSSQTQNARDHRFTGASLIQMG